MAALKPVPSVAVSDAKADQKVRRVGPHSRPHTLAKLDRRTRESRAMEALREALIAHVGGTPSAVEAALIERCVTLALYVSLFDRKAFANGGLSERDAQQYLAYHNTLTRSLARLGLKGAPAPVPTLEDYMAKKRAREATEAAQAGAGGTRSDR